MTDHNSSAGAVGGGQPAGQPGPFGPPQQPWQGQEPAQAQGPDDQHGGYAQRGGQPQQSWQLSPEAARAQVAAAWVRGAPQAGQAAVPALPPRESRPTTGSKKEKREQARAARKAEYEAKKAAKQQRQKGGTAAGKSVPAGRSAQATAPAQSPVPAPAPASVSTAVGPSAGASDQGGMTAPRKSSGDFDVPRPGGRLPSGGRRTHVGLRAALLITTGLFALGSCGVTGLLIGKSSGAGTTALDQDDVARYGLTEFPTQQAAAFAEQYATLCLTYSPETASDRRAALARYTSAGVDPECGWSGEGTRKALTATWDGTSEKLPEYNEHGRYLGIQVRTDDGGLTTLTVPVYVKNLTTGEGIRIAGDVGEMPMPPRSDVPEVDRDSEDVDTALGQQLQQTVLPGYFEAWAKSDRTTLARFTAQGATLAATTGLSGRLSEPQVNDVVALVPKGVRGSAPYSYKTGQAVELRVVVDWADPEGDTARRSYRITVVNTAQGWFIKDIRGGLLDAEGGRGDDEQTEPSKDEPGTGKATPSAPAASSSPGDGSSRDEESGTN
ncbi:conjugal transfer protein [Streptomyces scabiei]|uniref:Conjugative transposon protein TcpC n=1 Tax=Streptomyces scabiei TaxID=1930 RepID=A0A100JRB7_STRSC|nr:conjugal transfer protein [Streptomyces scabiei]GAQ64186.1 conjugative transposon protein TcpC [Streptomyces scabiei]